MPEYHRQHRIEFAAVKMDARALAACRLDPYQDIAIPTAGFSTSSTLMLRMLCRTAAFNPVPHVSIGNWDIKTFPKRQIFQPKTRLVPD